MSYRRTLLASALLAAGCGDNGEPTAAPDAAVALPAQLAFYDLAQAIDVSPDGKIAVFGDISNPEGELWVLDTTTFELTNPTDVGDSLAAFATGVSNTGRISALHGNPVQSGIWSASTDWTDIPSPHAAGCDINVGGAWDISADGHVVVGMTWNECATEGFRWTDASGLGVLSRLDVLGAAPTGSSLISNRATVVSDDGQLAAGWASTTLVDRAPARWTADGHGELLPRVADDVPGEVLAIDADGDVLAGVESPDGVVWTGDDKAVLPRFDTLLPSDPVFPNALTADGAVVFGAEGDAFFGVQTAFVWSATAGLRRVDAIAAAAGLTIPADVQLGNVLAVSADATVLIGTAVDTTTAAASVWAMRVPVGTFTD